MTDDATWMRLAVAEARCGEGLTSPNPCVGAVLVKDGAMVSSGWHRRAGGPHAEVEALRGRDARGGTLYVTLEPCSTHGRTPPCVDAVIAESARFLDSHPDTKGRTTFALPYHTVVYVTLAT